jgi:polysaccharide pyruvyl transferase WcaK-like protein
MKKEIKIAIYGASPYSGNRGVGALSYATLFLLKELEKEYYCKFKIFLINSIYGDKQSDFFKIGDENVNVINLYPIDCFKIRELIILFFSSKMKRTLQQYRDMDFVLNIGEGDSFSDIYGRYRFFSINNQNKVALFLKKNLLLLPQTIGPFGHPKIKQKAIQTINRCNTVLARDKQSYDFLKENTQQKNIDEIIDVAFYMPYQKKEFPNKYVHVGLNVSALLWHGGYTQDNQFGLVVDYPKLVHSMIDFFLSIPNVMIHIVPHVVSTNYEVENDYAVSYHLVEEYANSNLILSPLFLTPVLAKNYIAGLDFFIGARMHATIAAFSTGVPVVPMAYSRKFNGLFIDTLNYPYMCDMKIQSNGEILNGIKDAFEKREELKENIQERMSGIVSEKKELLKKYLIEFLQIR